MAELNRHATAMILGDRGVLVTGRSGAGKTTVALAAIAHWHAAGMFACLVADDQVFLSARNGRLVATAPNPIAGLVEAYGAGPQEVTFEAQAIIDLVIELVSPDSAPRVSDDDPFEVMPGAALPRLVMAERNARGAVLALAARLSAVPLR